MLREATKADAAGIAEIYNYYILKTVATFEEQKVTTEDIEARLQEIKSLKLPWIVEESEGRILGYAYASRWKGRCAYRFSVEITIYLDPQTTNKGLGTLLYKSLFEKLRQLSYHVVIAGISLPNKASIALHEKFGMKKVGHFSEVGYKFSQWVDVGYWQGTLDT